MIGHRDNGNVSTWKRQIPRYLYDIVLSAYCGLIFLIVEIQSVPSPIYDPVYLFLGWNPSHRREADMWGLVGLTALLFFLIARLLGLYGPVRRLFWRGTGLVVLAGYFPFWWYRASRPEAILLVPFDMIAVVGIYLAGRRARSEPIGTALKAVAVILHFSFWAWLDWREFGDFESLIRNSGVLVCPVLGAALGIMWILDFGRE